MLLAVEFAEAEGQRVVARWREVVVCGEAYLALAVGIQAQVERLLRVGQQRAPAVEFRLAYVDYGSHGALRVGYGPAAVAEAYSQRYLLDPAAHLKHLGVVGHLLLAEAYEQSQYLWFVLSYYKCVFLARHVGVRRHVVGQHLLLERYGDVYVAVVLEYARRLVRLP